MSNELAALKKQADEMGLAYHPNIGAAKLREKIAAANAESPAEAVPEALEPVLNALADLSPEEVSELEALEEFDDAPVPDAAAPDAAVQAPVVPAAPAKPTPVMCTPENVTEALAPFVSRGLQIVALTPEYWHIRNGKREDSGNLKMPLATLKQCAMLLMGRTSMPTEDLSHDEILALKVGTVR